MTVGGSPLTVYSVFQEIQLWQELLHSCGCCYSEALVGKVSSALNDCWPLQMLLKRRSCNLFVEKLREQQLALSFFQD